MEFRSGDTLLIGISNVTFDLDDIIDSSKNLEQLLPGVKVIFIHGATGFAVYKKGD